MRSKSIVLLALALGCGLVASIGISQVMERRNGATATPGETELIFVAKADINQDDPITPQNIGTEEWPKSKVPNGALSKLEEVEGKRCKVRMFTGEPIVAAKIMGANEREGAAVTIPKGFRAVAVSVDPVSGGGSLILPGDRVDVLVYLAMNPSLGIMETSTKTVLQDIKVFAVDNVFKHDHEKDEKSIAAKTISLLVTPQQAEKVTLASQMGTIRLIMRNQDDNVATLSGGARASDVSGDSNLNRTNEVAKPATPAATPSAAGPAVESLLNLINKQRQGKSDKDQDAGPFKMMLIKGADLSEVEIRNGSLPTVIGGQPGAPTPPVPATTEDPLEDSQPLPPIDGPAAQDGSTGPVKTEESRGYGPQIPVGGSATLTK